MDIIDKAPENYKETLLFSLLNDTRNSSSGLLDKVTQIIEVVRPWQDLILAGPFQSYTLHNPQHSKKLVHLMKYVIPEDTMLKLSELEIAIIILSCYLHDLGLFLSPNDRDLLIKSVEFNEFLKGRIDLSERIEKLRDSYKRCPQGEESIIETSLYQLMEVALAEYLRPIHATRNKYIALIDKIKKEVRRDDILTIDNVSFESELIEVCISHNLDSNALMESHGLNNYRFPRNKIIGGCTVNTQYCAAVLRIADILDFDSERTPLSLFNSLGIQNKRLPGFKISLEEWNKHLAVHTISIDKHEIVVSGTSEHPDIEHSVREFCNIIEQEIKETRLILQENKQETLQKYDIKLPFIVRPDIIPNSYIYRDLKIKLNDQVVTKLLMGHNLYTRPIVAVRELVQNSIDACNSRLNIEGNDFNPIIQISTSIDEDSRRWIQISDNGIGMDEHVISNYFLNIGNRYYFSNDFRKVLASRSITNFTPISRFGIGFLSVFMLGDAIKVTTRMLNDITNDYKSRTLVVENLNSLAYMTESNSEKIGTKIEVLLKPKFNYEKIFEEIIEYLKNTIVRPIVPVVIENEDSTIAQNLITNNFAEVRADANKVLMENGIQLLEINVNEYSSLISGKVFILLHKQHDGKLSFFENSNDLKVGKHPLKLEKLFLNLKKKVRITVNGILMKYRNRIDFFSISKKYPSIIIDIDVKGTEQVEYNISRDRIHGQGVHTIRTELIKAIDSSIVHNNLSEVLDSESKDALNKTKAIFLNPDPLNQGIMDKILKLLPNNRILEPGAHKRIAHELGIPEQDVFKYIKASRAMDKV